MISTARVFTQRDRIPQRTRGRGPARCSLALYGRLQNRLSPLSLTVKRTTFGADTVHVCHSHVVYCTARAIDARNRAISTKISGTRLIIALLELGS